MHLPLLKNWPFSIGCIGGMGGEGGGGEGGGGEGGGADGGQDCKQISIAVGRRGFSGTIVLNHAVTYNPSAFGPKLLTVTHPSGKCFWEGSGPPSVYVPGFRGCDGL